MNNKINKILTIITITIIFISTIVFASIAKSTYSASDNGYIYFKESRGSYTAKTCQLTADNKLTEDCVSFIDNLCVYWSEYKWGGSWYKDENGNDKPANGNQVPIRATSFAEKVFTESDPDTYYCVAGESRSETYKVGCYQCLADSNIIKWAIYPTGDSNCLGGYTLTQKTESECVVNACYKCTTDETIVDWRTSGDGDNQCSAGYKKLEGVTEANCKYVAPEPTYACYECKTDKTIVDWLTSGAADNKCSGGYRELTGKTRAQCKYVAPEPTNACYECKADKNILTWKDSALGNNICPGGYNKTVKTKAQCEPVIPENPKTGSTAIIFTWIIASIAMGCSLWYLKNDALSK